ncbi:LiaF transmembrane domain-containing protein [Shivajiella indica]|uniref:LiaI-LiaF-like domain-containing protein n=1 Tax=Shivajiella indica TaxID=872115 RepID=A0ABW5BBK4_9BACT
MTKRGFSSTKSDLNAGLVILIIGGVLLLKAIGFWFPSWIFSWPMILIVIGLVISAKNNFQSGFGVVLLLVGSFFLIKRNFGFPFEVEPYLIPIGLIIFGLYLILKRSRDKEKFNEDFFKTFSKDSEKLDGNPQEGNYSSHTNFAFNDTGDTISAQALFTGIQKRVLSKNFKGGKASAIFGGTEIDLSQADLAPGAMLNVEVAFGGVKLVVPPHWDLQINVSNVFAGVEDKRMYPQTAPDPSKVLRIYGSVVFGGLEIKSF